MVIESNKAINIPHDAIKKNDNSTFFIDYQGIMLYTSLSTYRHPFIKFFNLFFQIPLNWITVSNIYKQDKKMMFHCKHKELWRNLIKC